MLVSIEFDGEVVVPGFEARRGVGEGLGEVAVVEAGDEVVGALEGGADGGVGLGVAGEGLVGVVGCGFLGEEEGERG